MTDIDLMNDELEAVKQERDELREEIGKLRKELNLSSVRGDTLQDERQKLSAENARLLSERSSTLLLFNAIRDSLREMEKSPDDSVQDIWNEQLKSWHTRLRMNHLYEIEEDGNHE